MKKYARCLVQRMQDIKLLLCKCEDMKQLAFFVQLSTLRKIKGSRNRSTKLARTKDFIQLPNLASVASTVTLVSYHQLRNSLSFLS